MPTITTPAELDAIRSSLAGDYILGANKLSIERGTV